MLPVGTPITFILGGSPMHSRAREDLGLHGYVVGGTENHAKIFLPESTHQSPIDFDGAKVTWTTPWQCCEIFNEEGKQYEFKFMECTDG